jgi:selenium donor protein
MKKTDVKLTSMVKTSGCAAKLAPSDLHSVIDSLPLMKDDNLVAGFETADDALIYKIDEDRVCIETVDFFPPMVDDPYTFGQVAAANALSDAYAMGSKPAVCMNLMCFPACLELSIMRKILEGGLDKANEAGAVIAGGHTISDPTPKYGLCVTSFAKLKDVWQNSGAKPGDVLVLTKALGTGIAMTAAKAEMAEKETFDAAVESMTTLNKRAYETAKDLSVHAATDVTGFSLMGHSYEMASGSNVTIEIDSGKINLFPGVMELAEMGLLPEGRYNNGEYLKGKIDFSPTLSRAMIDVLFDPQTSGGLLLSLSESDASIFIARFGYPGAIIGRVTEFSGCSIKVC